MVFDIPSLAVGVLGGFLVGVAVAYALLNHFVRDRSTLTADVHELLQKNARLESDLEKEKSALADQLKFLEQTKQQMTDSFKALSLEALNASRESFLALAQERLKNFQDGAKVDLEKRESSIKQLVDPVSKSLEKMDEKISQLEKERHNAYGELREHLKSMRTDQDRLRTETSALVQALRSPSARGQWGEMQLKRTLEMAGLVEGIHYQHQVTVDSDDGRQRPDIVVNIPGKKHIVIDAKAPIDAYLDSLKEGISETARIAALERHARHVRDHIKALGSKNYWQKFDTPEMVVMFLPGESYLPTALDHDPSLLEYAFELKVMPTSPTTLVPLLKSIAYGWQQEKLAENAREISNLGAELYKRLCVFSSHLEKIGKGLTGAINSYNGAIGSFTSRVIPSARKFQEMQHLTEDENLPDLMHIEQMPSAAPDFSSDFSEKEGSTAA